MIDTLKAVDTLKAHGFDDSKARAIADVVARTQGDLATQGDIATIRGDIATIRGEVASVRYRTNILTWLIGLLYPLVVANLIALLALVARL